MAVTVSDFIHSCFRLIGAIASGETLETAELNDAFISLNQLVASWAIEGLTVAGRLRVIVATSTSNSYSLATRQTHIQAANLNIAGIDCPLDIVDAEGWEEIPEKGQTAIIVRKLFCDYGYPVSTVYLWPTPKQTGSLELWTLTPVQLFTSTSQNIDLPPGYEIALRYNFAVSLLPEFPRENADPALPALAQSYKASIVQLNASNHARSTPPPAIAAPVTQ